MSGNPNAKRPASKKGPTRGSGGKRARGLQGKGPTPKAEDRTYHPAHARKLKREEAQRQAEQRAAQSTRVRKELQLAEVSGDGDVDSIFAKSLKVLEA